MMSNLNYHKPKEFKSFEEVKEFMQKSKDQREVSQYQSYYNKGLITLEEKIRLERKSKWI